MPDFNSFKEFFCQKCGAQLYAWKSRRLCEPCEQRIISHEKKLHEEKQKAKSKKFR